MDKFFVELTFIIYILIKIQIYDYIYKVHNIIKLFYMKYIS